MRILIAGGAGFVGSHLVRRFIASGHSVVVVDDCSSGRWTNLPLAAGERGHGSLVTLHGDVCDLPSVGGRLDAVLHLASAASPIDYLERPIETLLAGSIGTRALLERARADRARFLLASTSEVYGDPLVHPQPESYWGHVNPVGPRSVYDEAKRFAEAMASAYARHHGLKVRIARIFNTYGPRMRIDDGRVIPTFVSQALRGDPLTVYGDGAQTRSYCYVDDLVAGLDALLWSDVEGPVNLGNPEEYSVMETAETVLRLTGSASRIVLRPAMTDDPRRRKPDIGRARSLLDWQPRTPFQTGLLATIRDLAVRLAPAESRAVRRQARFPAAPELGTADAGGL